MTDPIVIVGGGPAGLAAARAYREAGGTAPVRLLTMERRAPYNRPPLTKAYLRGEVPESDLPLEDRGWYAAHDVELVLGATATALNPAAHTLTVVLDGAGPGRELVRYSACVLATGSAPKPLPIPGADHARMLRGVVETDVVRADAQPGRAAVVVGSGFIGCEAAASLALRGCAVVLVTPEPVPHATRLGAEVGERVAAWLRGLGVDLLTKSAVTAIARGASGLQVVVEGREEPLSADVVVSGGGATPRLGLALDAGLDVRDGRGVLADERMRTSAPDVFAAGDVAFAHNAAAGRHLAVEHWGEALAMGAVAGRVLAGADAAWDTAPGFWSTIGEQTLKQVAWGDGYDTVRVDGGPDAWTAWYARDGVAVGVLTHQRDQDYERGQELVERGRPVPPPTG